ncbi:MAG: hypothetical protein AB7O04_05925 [Hyphomonadaceae bacterium]
MKPHTLIAQAAEDAINAIRPAKAHETPIERQWMKVNGQLECRFVCVNAR